MKLIKNISKINADLKTIKKKTKETEHIKRGQQIRSPAATEEDLDQTPPLTWRLTTIPNSWSREIQSSLLSSVNIGQTSSTQPCIQAKESHGVGQWSIFCRLYFK